MQSNDAQNNAINHIEGPMLVLAGPGSGKTTVITRRVKRLIEQGVNPLNILVITFTKAAAEEMRERFYRLMDDNRGRNVTFGTFHAVFFTILKHAYNLSASNIVKEEERYSIVKNAITRHELDIEDEREFVGNVLGEIGRVKSDRIAIENYYSTNCPSDVFRSIYEEYSGKLRGSRKIDFEDMLCYTYELLTARRDILSAWQSKFKYILIDEFQDINQVQYEIVKMLAGKKQNLFLVGDDDQSIYGFRGAKPELMLYMKQEFPSLRTISLTVNYRSTEFITGAAARVILHNDTRFYKRVQSFRGRGQNVHVQEVLDEQEEAQYVTEEIQKKLDQGIKPGEIAVLFRAAVQARMISEILSEHRIPFEMRDYVTNFYRHFIVKDIMAYLQLAAGKRDRSLFLTICNRPLRYLARNSMENRQVNFEDLRKFYCDKDWMLDIIDQFDVDVRMMKNMAPYAAIQYIRKKIGYDDFLKEYAEKHQISWKQLMDVMAELEERSKNFKSYDEWEIHIAKYTQELEEQQAKARKIKGERENKVQLMTIHSAKGLEFEDVFVIHANEGEIPHQKAEKKDEIEEERRLFYVALTRAKNNLCISYITQKNGNSIKPSRFVEELLGQRIK